MLKDLANSRAAFDRERTICIRHIGDAVLPLTAERLSEWSAFQMHYFDQWVSGFHLLSLGARHRQVALSESGYRQRSQPLNAVAGELTYSQGIRT